LDSSDSFDPLLGGLAIKRRVVSLNQREGGLGSDLKALAIT
jgi:hypothetical protein